MATATQTQFKRDILDTETNHEVTTLLQSDLVNLIDLALILKQAHWNVFGSNFRSVHIQLDEIIETTRHASDEVAERIATLGVAADGRSRTVAEDSALSSYPRDFASVTETVELVSDAVETTIKNMRESISKLGELDPVSEDMLIGISGPLEKHLWMLQAQEG